MAEHLLEVENLKMYFKKVNGVFRRKTSYVKAVDNISFTIDKKETFGLVGESGCGKTTTGRALIRLYEPTGGTIRYDGEDITKLSAKDADDLSGSVCLFECKNDGVRYYRRAVGYPSP